MLKKEKKKMKLDETNITLNIVPIRSKQDKNYIKLFPVPKSSKS